MVPGFAGSALVDSECRVGLVGARSCPVESPRQAHFSGPTAALHSWSRYRWRFGRRAAEQRRVIKVAWMTHTTLLFAFCFGSSMHYERC